MIQEVPYDEVLKIRKEVMYPDQDLDFVKLTNDHESIHMGYYINGKAVSILSLFLKNNELQFRKFATLQDQQGKDYGTKLIEWVLDYAKSMNFDSVWCNARQGKLSFYKKFGFKETDKTFEKNGYTYIIIKKELKD